ncbi:MAG: DUF2752 domain-containing protein [Lachnospiraceae bacterium]|nr:DUF2752 domain-containing protein [Lachnospiraceae bacterium]
MWKLIRQDIGEHWKPAMAVLVVMAIFVKCFGGACISKLITGLPCPACGMSRAAGLFLKGQIKESLQMQPLFILLIIGAILLILCRYVCRRYEAVLKYYAAFLIVFAIVFYVYRMIRYFPDAAPMTYWRENLFYMIGQRLHTLWERI